MATLVVKATGPHIRIKGHGSVRMVTSTGIVRVPVLKETDVKFSPRTSEVEKENSHSPAA